MFAAMIDAWAEDVALTRASRFRRRGTIALEHMFPYYLAHSGQGVFVPKREVYRDTRYLGLENVPWLTRLALARLRRHDPKFYCLNDNYGDAPNPRCVAMTRDFLESRYPDAAPWERAGG